LQVLLI